MKDHREAGLEHYGIYVARHATAAPLPTQPVREFACNDWLKALPLNSSCRDV